MVPYNKKKELEKKESNILSTLSFVDLINAFLGIALYIWKQNIPPPHISKFQQSESTWFTAYGEKDLILTQNDPKSTQYAVLYVLLICKIFLKFKIK